MYALVRRAGETLSRPRAQLALLLAVTALVHAVHVGSALRDPYLQSRVGDEAHYDTWGRAIAGGALTSDTAFLTSPLYAYWLAALYRLAGDSLAIVQFANAALVLGTVALTWAAAYTWTAPCGRGRALAASIAACLVAFSRVVLFHESTGDKTALVLLLTAGAIYAVIRADERPSLRRWALAGAIAGLAALAHPLLLVLVPSVAIHSFAAAGWSRAAVRVAVAHALGAAIAIVPATLHNAVRSHELIPVCSNGGMGLYIGNHAGNVTGLYTSPPFSVANVESERDAFQREAERRTGRAMGPGEVSRFWTVEAVREMADNPRLSFQRFLRKLRWTVNDEELTDTRTYSFYVARLRVLRVFVWDFGLVAFLGLLGAVLAVRDRRATALTSFVALYALALASFFVFGRYRLPMIVPLAILAGTIPMRLGEIARSWRARTWALAVVTCVAVGAAVFGSVLPSPEESFFPDYYNQGNRYVRLGQPERALAEYEKAISIRPGDHPAVTRTALFLVEAHLQRGDRASAIRVLGEAIRVRPSDPALHAKLSALAAQR